MKIVSGYPKGTRVTLFTLKTPENPLQQCSPWSALPGPRPFHGTAHSRERGPRHQSTCVETRMDRPKSVQRVIRGVASRETINVNSLFVGKFWHVRHPLSQSIRLRLSVFSALLGPAMESQVYPPSQSDETKKTNAHITPVRPLCRGFLSRFFLKKNL